MARKISKANPFLHLFSGEDIEIIKILNNSKINRVFNIIGFAVITICVICFISAVLFMFNVLSGIGKLGSIPIGVFWGFSVTIIYLLLLYTISPPLLLDKKMFRANNKGVLNSIKKFNLKVEKFRVISDWLTLSMCLRITFIGLFAIIIAQPFNVILFTSKIQNELDLYKSHYKSEIILQTDSTKISDEVNLYNEYLSKIHLYTMGKADSLIITNNLKLITNKINYDKVFLANAHILKNNINKKNIKNKERYIDELSLEIDNEIINDNEYLELSGSHIVTNHYNFVDFRDRFNHIIEDKVVENTFIVNLIDNNSFYLRRIIVINANVGAASLVNIACLALFLFPIYLKFIVRKIKPNVNSESFYSFKQKLEYDLVNKNYKEFKLKFNKLFGQRQHLDFKKTFDNLKKSIAQLKAIDELKALSFEKAVIGRYYPYVNISDSILMSEYDFTSEELDALKEKNEIVFFEKYEDPPFNLKPKKFKIDEYSGQSLINEVWGDA